MSIPRTYTGIVMALLKWGKMVESAAREGDRSRMQEDLRLLDSLIKKYDAQKTK